MSVYQRLYREQRARQYKGLNQVLHPSEPDSVIKGKIKIHGKTKTILANTPDEFLQKLSQTLSEEKIDVFVILTKKAGS